MKLLLTLFLTSTLSVAALINGIALTVNEDPITLYEIKQMALKQHISEEKATFELIRQKLTKQVSEQKNISVSDEEVQHQIDTILEKNSLTKEQFEQKLKIEGLDVESYKEQFTLQRLQQKLIGALTASEVKAPTDKEKAEFYELHKNEFSLPQTIEVTQYQSSDPQALSAVQKSPLFSPQGVKISQETLNFKSINPQLAEFLLTHKERMFTRIVPIKQDLYMMFYIKKFGKKIVPKMEDIDKELTGIIQNENRNTIINNFFSDEMHKAHINYIRVPPLKL